MRAPRTSRTTFATASTGDKMLAMGVDSGSRGARRFILEHLQLLTYRPIATGPGSAKTIRAAVAAAIA